MVLSQTSKSRAYMEAVEQRRTLERSGHQEVDSKLRAEIKKTETKRTIQRTNETKSWIFERISKIDNPLSNLLKDTERSSK